MERWTAAQYREFVAGAGRAKRGHKYGAVAVVIDGHRFPSQLEGKRYRQLRLLERAGAIEDLKLQPRFPLYAAADDGAREVVATYVGDFAYSEWRPLGRGALSRIKAHVVEDAKGVETPTYVLKSKMFRAQYPRIDFREIKAPGRRKARPCRKK